MPGSSRSIRQIHLLLGGVLLCGALRVPLAAQVPDVSLLLRGSYTTTAQIYPNPSSLSPNIRHEHFTVEDLTGLSAEIHVPLDEGDYAVSLSGEYISYVDEGTKPIALGGIVRTLPVRDGFSLVSLELGGIAIIPLQSQTIRLTMSGGGGWYVANRILEVAGVGVRATETSSAFGIFVAFGFDYRIAPGIWAHVETRFRDPDITMEYEYEAEAGTYDGAVIPFPTSPMRTRVNVDGMSMAAGLMIELPAIFR